MATLTQLEYIVTVERLRHFGRAAEACHVSQPSLSMQIQKVEDEMGITIFDRIKKPVLPTENGKKFIEQAKIILRENQKLNAIAKHQNAEVSGEFKLGIIPTLAPYLLPLFIEDFSKAYPKVQLRIHELKTETIIHDLREDALDGALLATPLLVDGLKEKVLFYEKFFLYAGKDHALFNRKRIDGDRCGIELGFHNDLILAFLQYRFWHQKTSLVTIWVAVRTNFIDREIGRPGTPNFSLE